MNSPRKHITISNLPTKSIRSPLNSSPNKNKHFWQNVFNKEIEKVKKKATIAQNSTNDHSIIDDDMDEFEDKHPYVTACFDKVSPIYQCLIQDFIQKRVLVKNGSKVQEKNNKENQLKERNILSDLPDQSNYLMQNGIQFQLKKVYGQYQIPIQKSVHFISNSTIIFLVGNYIAVHNVLLDETRYIGIEQNLSDITCFEVQTVDTILKGDFSFNAQGVNPNTLSPQKQQVSNQTVGQEPILTNTQPSKSENIQLNLPLNQNQQIIAQQQKELMTLIAFAERAQETFMKEQKYGSKRVYGISSQGKKKQQQMQNHQSSSQQNSPTRLGGTQVNLNNQGEEQQSLKFVVRVNIFNLNSPLKRYVLSHYFDEYFYVKQIYMREKDSFCYTLCSNKQGEQIFFIWNFRKETILAHTELKARVNKFNVSPHKNELILFLGDGYLKYHEANFTNKMMKENSLNIVPMKIEKESNFVDLEYLPKTDIFIIITDSNHVFIFEKNALKFKLMDQLEELGKQTDSVMSDSLEIGDLSDKEEISKEEEHLIIPNVGTNSKNQEQPQNAQTKQQQKATKLIHDTNEDDDPDGLDVRSFDQALFKGLNGVNIKFQKVLVTQRGFMIGATNGYFFLYEFQKEEQPPRLMFQVHLSNKIKSIVSMSLSRGIPKNEEYLVAIAGVYKKQNKINSLQPSNFEGGGPNSKFVSKHQMTVKTSSLSVGGTGDQQFFMPKVLESPRKGVNPMSMSLTKHNSYGAQNVLNVEPQNDEEERIEYSIINLRSIQTQQLNKIVSKVFSKGAHDGSIYQLSQCRHKSWLYTLSEGNNLKIWNHTNDWNGVANYYFDEQPICIDVHPSSWQICLGFKSGIKIYQSLDKCLKLQFEKLGKAALALQYSDGGQYLACANAVYVEIIDPMRMQLLCTLFGHKGLIRTINWTPNSKYLISTCNNGGIFMWKGNFKEQTVGRGDITQIACLNDKNYQYQQVCYDDDLDAIIALTNTSSLRIFLIPGLDCVHEEIILTLPSCKDSSLPSYALGGANYGNEAIMMQQIQTGVRNGGGNLRVTCMSFAKGLGIIAVGYSNGSIGIINWPIAPNRKTFKYEIFLQQAAVTDIMFTFNQKYLIATTDDGNIYILETIKVTEGTEKSWHAALENQEYSNIKKRREHNGLRGFSITDNFIMCNKNQLEKVNKKIEKLELQIKTHEVNYKIKVAKKLKKFEKQKKLIDKDLQESLTKQDNLIKTLENEFQTEKDRLYDFKKKQREDNIEENAMLVDTKEQNLAFVKNECDELENKILRFKQSIINELEKIENDHANAVLDLVNSYEQSIKQAQEEVKNTIDKLKSNGSYYEGMIALQERDYEGEIGKLQTDLIEECWEFDKKRNHLQEEDDKLKNQFQVLHSCLMRLQEIEDNFKEKNYQRKTKLEEVKRLNFEHKNQETNIERLGEKQIQSDIFIDEKEASIVNNYAEKKQLENVIIFLSSKIKELKDERKPLDEKKRQMEIIIEDTYRELQDDFKFRRYMELKEGDMKKKMKLIESEIKIKQELGTEITEKMRVFKRELTYLIEAKSMKGWILKVQGMLICMKEVQNCKDPEDAKKVSMQFVHITERIESNARPFRANQEEDEVFIKQSKMNEVDLAYHRNKSSKKILELKFRYKQLFKQLEKQIVKIRNETAELVKEFNELQYEHKKLNDTRLIIKESIKDLLGDDFDQDMLNSSDDDSFRKRSKKNKQMKQLKEANKQQSATNGTGSGVILSRSKSTSQISQKNVGVGQSNYVSNALTARDLYNSSERSKLPDVRSKIVSGSVTQRDNNDSDAKKHLAGGFILNNNKDIAKKRLINSITNKTLSVVKRKGEGRKYLDKIVEEFEKNRKQIEEQTKNMQTIQHQMNLLLQTQNQLSQSTQQLAPPQIMPSSKVTAGTGMIQQNVPNLNLASIKQLQNQSLSSSAKQTFTTRIPNTSDRTTISVLDQGLLGASLGGQQNRKLPIIKESEFSSLKEANDDI